MSQSTSAGEGGDSETDSTNGEPFQHDYDTGNATVDADLQSRTVEVEVDTGCAPHSEPMKPAIALRTATQIEAMPAMFLQFTNPDGVAKAMKEAVEWLKQESDIVTDGGTPTDTDSDTDEEWRFKPDDIAREKYPQPSPMPGESEQDRREHQIKRQLIDPTEDQRYYYVEKENGNTTLYSAKVMRDYEPIDESESRAFPRDDETKITDGGSQQKPDNSTPADTTTAGPHAYCKDCDWCATPNAHDPYPDVPTAAEKHTRDEQNHTATVGSSDEVIAEARSRADTATTDGDDDE
jgi:hypothetical protein